VRRLHGLVEKWAERLGRDGYGPLPADIQRELQRGFGLACHYVLDGDAEVN
jgi:hypothetical protein